MQTYLSETRELAKNGQNEEALRRYVWFHNHALEKNPAMYGVRLSFALSHWKELGDAYPPAKLAIIQMRDRKEKSVSEGQGCSEIFNDVVALNRTLGEQDKTVSLFETIDQNFPDLATNSWNAAKDAVIEAKRFDLVKKHVGNPIEEFAKLKDGYDQDTALCDDPRFTKAAFKKATEKNFVTQTLQLIKVAHALGHQIAAMNIRDKALAILDDPRLRESLPEDDSRDLE